METLIRTAQDFRQNYLLIEYRNLGCHAPTGVYVLPASSHRWDGVMFLQHGPYRSGVFRFSLHLSDRYPDEAPRFQFDTPVRHPCVCPNTGTVDLTHKFADWTAGRDFIHHTLHYVKRLMLLVPNDPHAVILNTNMHQLMENDMNGFIGACQEAAQQSLRDLFQPTPSVIPFAPYEDALHRPLLDDILSQPQFNSRPQTAPAQRPPSRSSSSSITSASWAVRVLDGLESILNPNNAPLEP